MKFVLFLAIVAFAPVPAQLGSPCPPQSSIIPCRCSRDGQDTIMACAYHDPSILKLAFQEISSLGLIVDFFNISSTRLSAIESNFFLDMTVRDVLLYGSRWNIIADDAFSKQENSLARVAIQESLLTSVPVRALSILRDLEYLQMVHSEVTGIETNAFATMQSANRLRTLDLSENYIKTIGTGAFSKLVALRELYLQGNRIRSVPYGSIPTSNKIKHLDIR